MGETFGVSYFYIIVAIDIIDLAARANTEFYNVSKAVEIGFSNSSLLSLNS